MITSIPRSRASTLQDAGGGGAELQSQLELLAQTTSDSRETNIGDELQKKLEAAHRIRQAVLEDPGRVRDSFRRMDGFQSVVAFMGDISKNYKHHDGIEQGHLSISLNLLQAVLSILAAALQDHKGNQKYFRLRIDGGGWPTLKKLLCPMLLEERKAGMTILADRALGCLLACALDDESMTSFYSNLRRQSTSMDGASDPTPDAILADTQHASQARQSDGGQVMEQDALARKVLEQEISQLTIVHNPDAILIMFELWRDLVDQPQQGKSAVQAGAVSLGVPSTINHLAALNTRNLAALHGTGLLSIVLSSLLSLSSMDHSSVPQLRLLATTLLSLGIAKIDDAHFLYRHARSSSLIAELLQLSLKASRSPSYVHFDLSLNGYASIELPGIGRTFPPASTSGGYSLSLWFQIVHFDHASHTTIFGAFDASQTCFVLVYLEKDTHNLILQTSVTSSRPSVRFKSTAFKERRWYHVVIAHRRPKGTSTSRASLFIDGEFVEQVKSQYPETPPSTNSGNESIGSPSSNRKNNAIQAFLGTPQDLASRLGKGLISTQWRLASATIFADVLSDDLIAVYSELGPRYSGNYQDCLGSFQTYQASAALNLRNESLHPGREERSDIVSAIKFKAGRLLPESKILLNISASIVLDDNDQNNIDETHLMKYISKTAGKNLRNVTRGGRNALAINGAIPSVNEALLHSSGFAVLTGDPTTVVPQSLDDAAWRIGGCAAVGLALLESAVTSVDVVRALNILFESVQENWRNSEAMERENGFGVLSSLLTTKLCPGQSNVAAAPELPRDLSTIQQSVPNLPLTVLAEILRFVGYRTDKPEDSVINNPLAYRILLVDMEFWRSAEPAVQKLYYEQFVVFGLHSKFHQFNTKRLLRMRITKKWLDALKGETFTTETFEYFLEAFKSFLTRNPSADSMRSLALYITYAIHKPRQTESYPARGKNIKLNTNVSSRRQTLSSASPRSTKPQDELVPHLSQLQVALKMLKLYADMLCHEDEVANIKKFARTVTNKWLLHLLADDESTVVVLAAKILARLLVINGPSYVQKFVDKTGGIVIMRHRFKRWWSIPTIWPICFAVLFGLDPGNINFSRTFDMFSLLETFAPDGLAAVVNPAMLPVITAMLEQGLKTVTREQLDPDSPLVEKSNGNTLIFAKSPATPTHARQRSMTLSIEPSTQTNGNFSLDKLAESASTLRTVIRFLADIHTKSQAFRDFTVSSPYVQELFFVLFPIVVSANTVSPETELHSRDSALTFKGNDVIMRPLSANSSKGIPVVRTATVEPAQNLRPSRNQAPKRMSSYILVTSDPSNLGPSASKLQPVISPSRSKPVSNLSGSIVEELLELTIAVFSDQIFARKDFPGLGLFMRVPPGFQEHQAYFETFILRNSLSHLGNTIKLSQKLLWEPRVLTNVARFAAHLGEAIYEGWFISGAEDTLDFLANILEYLQLPDISSIKAIRLCSQIITNIRTVLLRVVLLRLSELDDVTSANDTVAFLNKLAYWQTVLLPAEDPQDGFLKLLCYLVYNRLTGPNDHVRMAAANLWRMLLVQKHDQISVILLQASAVGSNTLTRGFEKIMELDNETFLGWVDDHREGLDNALFTELSKAWGSFVSEENRRTEETAKARVSKRRDKLKLWASENASKDEILRRHETGTDHWRSNIYAAEHLKRQRALQDQQDSQMFNAATWAKMSRELRGSCGVFDDMVNPKWQLDQTEGRNRMRMRFIADKDAHLHDYQPKRSQSQGTAKRRRSTVARTKAPVKDIPPLPNQSLTTPDALNAQAGLIHSAETSAKPSDEQENEADADDDFEMVDDPRDGSEEYEDKNRKVMRSLQRGDQVEHVHNVSRIVGLEAVEGLLILGKGHLYLLDNLFQRSDGEVVNVWQAPQEERDAYLQMISGREAGDRPAPSMKNDYETRSWRWEDVLSISKRRFLFRDVAIEVFFVDGRSYLLTTNTPHLRNELYQKLLGKATHAADSAIGEDSWRIESVKNQGDEIQTFGSRFTSVFAQNTANPATRKWMRGEISNFHYLMLVNTMAGRTFNDLTQYPVFPWVLADYTSDELDLTNPRTFRDLTKPMGCQDPGRQGEFKDRYQSFAEMGDERSPPFHYGTHYSSAMIVTSYLIRLQPFVYSYLLLQGGSFDHPDRLFYSMERAWSSASRENMTDVRELIPEFFYLPEFLLNNNHYDFGSRQGGAVIDTVELPPWAKGDPKIFIARHREALESEHVSRHLHQWIDLVFGQKQRGEAALEATNVFHHLSYHGAKDLDTIDDPVERLATIGIIHNFGQTPHQVFQRIHPAREDSKYKVKRLDTAAEGLTRLPFPLIETHDRIAYLQYSPKHEKLICSAPFRLNIGPAYDKYMEWGFIDGSVRFYAADTKKLISLFEHVHQGQLTFVLFADSKTLVTAGSDCTISVWTLIITPDSVDLQPKIALFGHRSAVSTLAVSRSFSALLSASSDGQVLLWDLNRLELVRRVTTGKAVECARINDVTGDIMLCRGPEVSLWTLNGDAILEQNISVEGDDTISSCAFYEGSGNEYLERNLIFTGHKKGVVNIWNIAISDGAFVLEHVKRMHHLDHAGYNIGTTITAILPMAQKVYTGDDDGRVYEWDCIQRQ